MNRTLRQLGFALLASICLAAPALSDPPDLVERQRSVRERMTRLENRMLELATLLAQSEPDKAERLRDTLDMAGKRQVRRQLSKLQQMLEDDSLSAADQAQGDLLTDLNAMLELLTSSLNELDRLREERERLAALKQRVEELQEQQRRLLYRTQQAGRQSGPTEPTERDEDSTPQGDDAGESQEAERQIRRLEELQRELQQQTDAASKDFPKSSEEGAESFPGEQSLEQAQQEMQEAADRLGQQQAEEAQGDQAEALDQMQQAIDKLEQQLRQLRQEEREETLAALAARIKQMLSQEQRVLTSVQGLQERDRQAWTRLEEVQLTEARTLHSEALEEADATVRILVEEGSTIVIPDLLTEIRDDMQSVNERLGRSDVGDGTRLRLEDIVGALQELLDAIERQQDRDAEPPDPAQQQQQQGQQGPRPLFDRSAELRLLRAAQVRINRRTERADADDAGQLSQRQERLADQVRRLREAE